MAKLNLLLLAVLVACALGLVTSQHKARRAFTSSNASMPQRASSRPSSGACSSRRAPGACIRASKGSPRDRSACARPTRGACASSGETRGGEQAGAGPGAPAGLACPLGADSAGRRLRAHGRAVYLQAVRTDFLQEKGDARYSRARDSGHARPHPRPQRRGSRRFDPGKVDLGHSGRRRHFRLQRRKLAALLSTPRTRKKLSDTSKDFVYLKRQVSPETAAAVQALGLKGIYEHPEYRRYYPGGEVTAHVIGFTGVDDTGQEVELAHQATLGGKPAAGA